MSLFSKIGKVIGKVASKVSGFIPGPLGAAAGIAGGLLGGVKKMRTLPALPGAVRALPGIGRTAGRVAGAAGAAVTGVAVYDTVGNLIGYKARRRRINPLNHRALNRALRRIEKVKHAMKRVSAITVRKEKC